MNRFAYDVERCIDSMAEALRGLTRLGAPEEKSAGKRGWWVLVVGDAFDEDHFEQREAARHQLRTRLSFLGIRLAEYEWVWDETRRAQVVAGTFPERELAEGYALDLREKGLTARVVREWNEDGTKGGE